MEPNWCFTVKHGEYISMSFRAFHQEKYAIETSLNQFVKNCFFAENLAIFMHMYNNVYRFGKTLKFQTNHKYTHYVKPT